MHAPKKAGAEETLPQLFSIDLFRLTINPPCAGWRGHIDHVHTPTPDVRDGAILAPVTQVILTETRRTTGIHNTLISGRWIIVIFVFAHR